MDILVVDDDADIREWVAAALAIDGHAVATAGDGLEALRLLDDYRPALVLLDLRMPAMDGPTFARRCRERFGDALPIIAMSAQHADQRAEPLPVAAFLPKPFDLDHLAALVARYRVLPPA